MNALRPFLRSPPPVRPAAALQQPLLCATRTLVHPLSSLMVAYIARSLPLRRSPYPKSHLNPIRLRVKFHLRFVESEGKQTPDRVAS